MQGYQLQYEVKTPTGKVYTSHNYFTSKKLINGKLVQWSQQGYEYYLTLKNLIHNENAQLVTVAPLQGIFYGENAQDFTLVDNRKQWRL